jgi:hypothetical protein
MSRKLTQDQESELAEMYASGEHSVASICRQFGIARVTAHRVAARQGVRRPIGRQPLVFSEAQIQEMIFLAEQKVSHAEIGRMFNTSQNKISRLLAQHGVVSTRGRSRRGEKHGAWKGGVIEMQGGYVGVYVPLEDSLASMRNSMGYVLEHRLVMARHLGRPLERHENVHHKNGIKNDNRLENLELWQRPQPQGVRTSERQHCATCTCGKLG